MYREIINNLSEDDYRSSIVNLHIHTKFSDGLGDCFQILESAKTNNYKFIAITDHNTVEVHHILKDKILLTGVEFDCWFRGVFIHLLAYGFDVNNKELSKFYAKTDLGTENNFIRFCSTRNIKHLIKAIHNAGGVAVLAHPACYWALNLDHFVKSLIEIGLDGIEVYYPYPRFRKYFKFHSATDVRRIADKYPQLIKTGGTDFHGKVF